jgi:hypothetical protein
VSGVRISWAWRRAASCHAERLSSAASLLRSLDITFDVFSTASRRTSVDWPTFSSSLRATPLTVVVNHSRVSSRSDCENGTTSSVTLARGGI